MSVMEKEIEAVKFLLESFFEEPANETARNILIKKEVEVNKHVKKFASFSIQELKGQLNFLQNQITGGDYFAINFILHLEILFSFLMNFFTALFLIVYFSIVQQLIEVKFKNN